MAEGIHGHSDTGYFTELQAVDVNEGEVIALIGANGAGKTTILHTIYFKKKD